MVRALKVVLPMVAILLLGMMFMMTKNVPELTEIPFASGALKERSKSEQVAKPNYMGMTKDGDVLNVFADTLTSENEEMSELLAMRPKSEIKTKDGRVIHLTSDSGLLRNKTDLFSMEGGVEILTSDGYQFNAQKVNVRLDQTWAFAFGPVTGLGPGGTFSAGSLEIKRSSETDALKFYLKGRVKVLYMQNTQEK